MFFWPLRSLVPLWKVFTTPSFPNHVGICLSRFERLFKVIVAFTGWYEWMNDALAFSRPSKKWFGVSAVKSSGRSPTAVRGLALRVCSTRHFVELSTLSVSLRLSKIAIMTFLQLWTSLSQITPKCGAPGGLNFQTTFSLLSHSLSLLCPTRSRKLSAHWLVQRSSLHCHWWWCLGSHVSQWILSLQLDITRCPMIVPLQFILLWLSGKWRGSTISSCYFVGTWLRRVESIRRWYEWMGTHVHQVLLGVDPPSEDELGWRFCVCIWYISTCFSLMRFSIQQSNTLVEECFSHTLCPRVGRHDAPSPTEFVRLDILLSIFMDVLHCNRDSNVAVDLSLK